ncbi:PRC-barrel domain-containing protein [Deinococcus sp. Leaf326]|uniref:PRC-barrel domain-containing protein n=1 Tax=Deinococcus sp. Leaf326 TaxID=1736338 RepID=UPI0006F61F36|nr:PRC-barrel domain-containing protein [Deinococcus sp. Leaf326]KQR35963.1 photosystem reaction center subunit H [Deinococcus sp. Leaf326]
MIKGKDILGRNIIALTTGERIEKVHDVVFDPQGNQVLALLVDEGGWFSAAKAVPFERVRSIGEDAIMIGGPDDVTTTREDGRLKDALNSKVSLIGMTLLTTDGRNLGRIADVFFDEHSGRVEGYEVTGGLFSDLSSGRTFVPAPEQVQIGHDAAIVPDSVAAAMEESEPGGIRGVLSSAGASISGAYQGAAEGVRSSYEDLATATKERQKEYVVGKTAGADLLLDDGVVLIQKGETITAEQAELAEGAGKLTALTTSATGGVISEAYGQARDRAQAGYEDLATATKERQKEYAVGKTAGADLLLDDGTLLVTKGETITAAHADQAEAEGKLASLATAATGGAISEAYGQARDRVQGSLGGQPEGVVGRVAAHNVMADSGELIVAAGVTITAYHLERAEATGSVPALEAAAQISPSAAVHTLAAPGVSVMGEPASVLSAQGPAHTEAPTVADTVGRRVRSDVRATGGSIVAVQGQIVTPAVAERARQLNVEPALIAATLGTPAPAAGSADTRAALSSGVASVSEGATNLLGRARNWLSEQRDNTEEALQKRDQEAQENRVRDALGRPVNRVILAPDDSIILNVGEIVTNKAVQAARDGDVLDILLDSVSKESVSIDPLASRPHESGTAALDSQGDPVIDAERRL